MVDQVREDSGMGSKDSVIVVMIGGKVCKVSGKFENKSFSVAPPGLRSVLE
jgi:hypothetical protein